LQGSSFSRPRRLDRLAVLAAVRLGFVHIVGMLLRMNPGSCPCMIAVAIHIGRSFQQLAWI
jgi:hypothetical protein